MEEAGFSPQPETHHKSTVKRKHSTTGEETKNKSNGKVPRKGSSHSDARQRTKTSTGSRSPERPRGTEQGAQIQPPSGAPGEVPDSHSLDEAAGGLGTEQGTVAMPGPPDLSRIFMDSLEQMLSRVLANTTATRQPEGQPGPSRTTGRGRASPPPPYMETVDEESSVSGNSSAESEGESQLWSADETEPHEQPSSSGLFKAATFSTLLSKAKLTTELGGHTPSQGLEKAKDEAKHFLFNTTAAKAEEVPSPLLFRDTLLQQWTVPTAGQPPLASERRFYNLSEDIAKLLLPPEVDEPLVALASTDTVMASPEEALKADDRKLEQVISRGFQMITWAVRAATSASFFNRAMLLWLRDLQARIPADNLRVHQDMTKLMAATEFSADATLHATKFCGRALGTSVAARRLLWLRNWPADIKKKWKLASSPFVAGKLFGDALEPALVTTKDGKKRMATNVKGGTRKRFSYNRKQPFRDRRDRFPPAHQPSSSRVDRQQDRGSRGRQFNSSFNPAYNNSGRRPFRGGRGRPDRKTK